MSTFSQISRKIWWIQKRCSWAILSATKFSTSPLSILSVAPSYQLPYISSFLFLKRNLSGHSNLTIFWPYLCNCWSDFRSPNLDRENQLSELFVSNISGATCPILLIFEIRSTNYISCAVCESHQKLTRFKWGRC